MDPHRAGELEGTPGWRSQHQPVGDISSIRPLHSFCGREKTTLITSGSYIEVKGATEGRTSTIDDERLKEVLPGDYVYIKTFKRGWSEPRREGPFEVVLATPTAVKVKGRKVWIHLNHCSRAPDLLRPVTSAGPDQQQPHTADDSGAEDQAVAGPSGVSRPITRSITRATPPDDEDSD
ncbi:hypothetical protein SRHO_G00019140 [Serrasalmus rhombeus]